MPDDAVFEADLGNRLRGLSGHASRPFDAGDVARAAVSAGARPVPRGVSFGPTLRVALVLGLLALAAVGAAIVGGRLLAPPPDAPRGTLAIGTSEGLFFAASDGSNPVLIDGRGPAFNPRWSPDGTTLVASMLLPDDANALVFVRANGDEYGRAGQAESYRWSRDGRFVAVDGVEPLSLWVQSAETGESVQVAVPEGSQALAGMDWTADGRLVVGIVPRGQGQPVTALWILDPAGGAPVALGGDAARGSGYPSVSPDGTRVAVWADGCDGSGTCSPFPRILDLASGQRRAEVMNVRGQTTELAWSPDGSALAFDLLVGDEQSEVFAWVFAWDIAGEVRQVTRSPGGRAWLNGWTPDGSALLVSRRVPDGSSMEMWRMDPMTGDGVRLAADAYGVALQPLP
jgi:Tol biopolymer transport system component